MILRSSLSLRGLYLYDNSLFDNLVVPDIIDKDILITNLLAETSELEVLSLRHRWRHGTRQPDRADRGIREALRHGKPVHDLQSGDPDCGAEKSGKLSGFDCANRGLQRLLCGNV